MRRAAAVALCALAGCSTGAEPPGGAPSDAAPSDGGCKTFDDSSYVPGAAPRSFKDDVVPIFARSCSFSSCHGSAQNPHGGLYLGPNVNNVQGGPASVPPFYPPDPATITKVHDGIVRAKGQLPVTMLLVEPGRPQDSFLMHKIDGDQSCSGIVCNDIDTGPCGESMPQRSAALETADANAIRDWILRGALGD